MVDKKDVKKEILERAYIIPLRKKCRVVPQYKKTNKAVKTVKEFLAKHMKVENRDLNKVKLDEYLNNFLWAKGIKTPPAKVKVKAIKEEGIVRVELLDMPIKLVKKKARMDKREAAAESKKKKPVVKAESPKEEKEPSEEKEEEEKKESVKEADKILEKAEHKQAKHSTKLNAKQPKHPRRQALAK